MCISASHQLQPLAPHEQAFADYFCSLNAPSSVVAWMIRGFRRIARLLLAIKDLGIDADAISEAVKSVWKGAEPSIVARKLKQDKAAQDAAKAAVKGAKPP